MVEFAALINYEYNRGPELKHETIKFLFEGDSEPSIESRIQLNIRELDKHGKPFLWRCEIPEEYSAKIRSTRKFEVIEGSSVVGHGIVQIEI